VNELSACDARQDDTESPGAGRRAKLRLSRGFPLGLAPQCHPPKFSLRSFDHSRSPKKVQIFAFCHFCLKPMAARIAVDSND
jgi:hypothetical protein